MPRRVRHLSFRCAAALLLASGSPLSLQAADPRDYAVQLSAQVQVLPAAITLQWAPGNLASGYTISRKTPSEQSWTPLASLSPAAISYRDSTVVVGAAYEYEVAQTSSDGLNAYGYIQAGIQVPFAGSRGNLVLVVDNTHAAELAPQLSRLASDLTGDGWTVWRHDVSPTAPPGDVKALIRNDYYSDPQNTKVVFLFGHVAVPYSGDLNPDMHPAHRGAWPADAYYGDMNGNWTDDSVYDTDAEDPRNHNVPGDGKFDQSDLPASLVLQVGRVDLGNLPAFSSSSEADLLRQYLDKNHQFRHKMFDVARRGLVRDNFGEIEGDAPATDAWRAYPTFFGPENISVVGSGSFFPTLDSQSYLWAYGCGGGEYYQADGVGSSSDFAAQRPQAVFFILHGSYFGDWDSPDNLLRAALASPGYGLVAAWSGLPHWFFHPMALGETIGLATLISQNNRGLYKNQENLSASQVHIALMGDPTLRMHVVAPPANLSGALAGGSAVSLNWSAAPEAIQGYYVYRASNPAGPFARLTRSFLGTTAYTDNEAPAGPKTYMVRAVKLESSASGTYYNPSQGIFVTIDGGGQDLPTVQVDAPNPVASESGPVDGAFVVSRASPSSSDLVVSFAIGGTAINGLDYETISDSVVIPAGSTSAWITIRPVADNSVEGNESVILTLLPSAAYLIGSETSAAVTINDATLNQSPTISPVSDVSMAANATAAASFTVNDPDTPASALAVSVSSSNPALVQSAGLVLAGSDTIRTVTIVPVANQSGSATLTLTVTDGNTSASTSFHLTVTAAGRLSGIARQANGSVVLVFPAEPGHQYVIQSSKDLQTWTMLSSGYASDGNSVTFTDSQIQANEARFYRVQWE